MRAKSLLPSLFRALLPRALWPRLSLLVLIATAPLLVLLLALALADGDRVVQVARDQLLQLARLAAEQQDDVVQEVSGLLRVLAQVPDVQRLQGAACDGLLGEVLAEHPRVNGLAVAGVDGLIGCGTNAAARGLSVADRPYFRQALANPGGNGVVISPLTISRATGKPALFLAIRLAPAPGTGRSAGIILTGVDLGWFASLPDRALGANVVVQVLDSRDGALLAQSPKPEGGLGQRFPTHPLVRALAASPSGGSLQTLDFEGTERIFGFAPMPGQAAGLAIAVGLPAAQVRADAMGRLRLSIGIAFAATCLAMLCAWPVAHITVLRPVGVLVAAASRVGAGDLSAKATMRRGAAQELRLLGAAFARMTRRLESRDLRIAAMQAEIAVSEGHHRLLADNANDMITRLSPDMHRVYVSPACRELLGYEPADLVGVHPRLLLHPADRDAVRTAIDERLLAGQSTARATYRARRSDGRYVWLETIARRLQDGTGFVAVTRDVSDRKQLERKLEEANQQLQVLARQDGLTGLANRRRFDEVLGEEYRRAIRTRSPIAVIMLDVDRFKSFNDTYGHPGGDACLRALAQALNGAARRPADLPARYGGEEFVLLLPDTDIQGAMALAERLREAVGALSIPHTGSEAGTVTASLGVAVAIPFVNAHGPAALMEAADAALYEAKHAGRNRVRLAAGSVAEAAS